MVKIRNANGIIIFDESIDGIITMPEKTVITKEYPSEWQEGMEPYYPVNDEKNQSLYRIYEKKAMEEEKVIFGGRLGEYKYYDMDKVIASAVELCRKELGSDFSWT